MNKGRNDKLSPVVLLIYPINLKVYLIEICFFFGSSFYFRLLLCLFGQSQGMEKVCCDRLEKVNERKSPCCVLVFTVFFLLNGSWDWGDPHLHLRDSFLFFKILFPVYFVNVFDMFMKEDF